MLTADKDSRRRGEEGTGEVESLFGRTKGMKMGDRVAKERPPEVRITTVLAPHAWNMKYNIVQQDE